MGEAISKTAFNGDRLAFNLQIGNDLCNKMKVPSRNKYTELAIHHFDISQIFLSKKFSSPNWTEEKIKRLW